MKVLLILCLLVAPVKAEDMIDFTLSVTTTTAKRVSTALNATFRKADGETNMQFGKRILKEYLQTIVRRYEQKRDAQEAKSKIENIDVQ